MQHVSPQGQRGGRYIVGTPKAMLRKVQAEVSAEGWREVRQGIQVKTVAWPEGGESTRETPVLCRSEVPVEQLDQWDRELAGAITALTQLRRRLNKLARAAA